MNPLPRTLAATMKLVGLRNKELAEAMTARGFKMSENTISKILRGDRSCSFEEVLAFSEITGAPLEWLSQGPEWLDRDKVASLPGASPNPGLLNDLSNPETAAPTGSAGNLVDAAAA